MAEKMFYVILKDFDRKIFSICGPVSDDTPYNFRTVEIQNSGRNVNCEACEVGETNKASIRSNMQEYGLTEDDSLQDDYRGLV